MRRNLIILSAVLVLLALPGAACAQWLETVIRLPEGTYPFHLCYDPADNRVYSANRVSEDVTVIDGASNEVVATVAVGRFPSGICYNPQNNKVYVSNGGDGTVTVIDCATNSVLATVAVGREPSALCYASQDNTVYCTSSYDYCLSVIDGATDSVVATVSGGVGYARSICYAPGAHKVYTVHISLRTVAVVDAAQRRVVDGIRVHGNPAFAFGCDSLGGKIYCGSAMEPWIDVIDVARNTVLLSVWSADQVDAFCYNPVGNKMYAASPFTADHSVTVIDCTADTVLAYLPLGYLTECLLYNHLNDKVYCGRTESTHVAIIDGSANRVVRTIDVGGGSFDFCHNPVQNRVYAAMANDSAIAVLRDSSGAVEETPGAEARGAGMTVASGRLTLEHGGGAVLRDIAGRRVLDLASGENDVCRVPPGVYFLQSADSGRRSAVRKVIIQR